MSWKITRPFKKIKFEADDPICLIIPVRRHEVESFRPEIRNLESNEDLHQQYQAWLDRRKQAASYGTHGELAVKGQGQYIRGEKIDGSSFSEHQTKLAVRPFAEVEPALPHAESASDSGEDRKSPSKPGIWKRLVDR
jgi:hypothetical protein